MKAIVDARRRRYARSMTGHGLEIGALGNPMSLPFAAGVLYSDVLTGEQIDGMYPGSRHPDVISDSERFPTVASETLDFIVANHVLEHLTDPLKALMEWHRILKPGGRLLLSVPDKRYTFDHRRKRTSLKHLEEDHRSSASPQVRNECHLMEWAEHVEGLIPGTPELDAWVAEQKSRGYAVHNHVWVLQDVLEILSYLRRIHRVLFVLMKWRNTSFLGNEFNLLLQKETSARLIHTLGPPIARLCALAMHPFHELMSRIRRGARRLHGA